MEVTQPSYICGLDSFSCGRFVDRTPQFNTITDFIGFPVFVPNSSIYLIMVDINHCYAVEFKRAEAVIKSFVKRYRTTRSFLSCGKKEERAYSI